MLGCRLSPSLSRLSAPTERVDRSNAWESEGGGEQEEYMKGVIVGICIESLTGVIIGAIFILWWLT